MHPTDPQLIRFLLDGESSRDAARVAAHLQKGCPECTARLHEYETLVQTMREDRTPEPPAEWVERAVRLHSKGGVKTRILEWCAGLREEVARLVRDSAGGPELAWAGTRHVADSRRVRFESDRVELDLQVEPVASGGILTGQLSRLEPEPHALTNARLLVASDEFEIQESETDELGEFSIEVGNVKKLTLRVIADGRLTIFSIPDIETAS